MEPQITFTVSLGEIDSSTLETVMEVMQFKSAEIKFVLRNLREPDYRELIRDFLNKEVTFAQLKKAVK